MKGRPKLPVTPMRILGNKVRVQQRGAGGQVLHLMITMEDITAVKDPISGERIWPNGG